MFFVDYNYVEFSDARARLQRPRFLLRQCDMRRRMRTKQTLPYVTRQCDGPRDLLLLLTRGVRAVDYSVCGLESAVSWNSK